MTAAKASGGQASGQAPQSHLAVILGLAVVARVLTELIFQHSGNLLPLAAWRYENVAIALSLCSGGGFASPFLVPSGPTAFLAPGYPLLIASILRVFGTGKLGVALVTGLQPALSIITVAVIAIVARRQFDVRTANLAALISALSPPFLLAPLYVWDTCLSALILVAAVGIAPTLGRNRGRFALAGIGCALAVLVNPALLLPLIAIFTWAAWRARFVPWLAIVCFLLTLAPWPIRNMKVMHSFIPLRSSFGFELWAGNHSGSTGDSSGYESPMSGGIERARFVQLGEVEYMREKSAEAKSYILANPLQFARLTLLRSWRYWAGSSHGAPATTGTLSLIALSGLLLARRRKSLFYLYLLPLLLFPLPYYVTHADVRFQYAIDPLLAILGGYACERFLHLLSPSEAFANREPSDRSPV